MNDQVRLTAPTARGVLNRRRVGIDGKIRERSRVKRVLSWGTRVDGEASQIDMGFVDEISRGETIRHDDTARRAGDGRPGSHVYGIVDVVPPRADIEDSGNPRL